MTANKINTYQDTVSGVLYTRKQNNLFSEGDNIGMIEEDDIASTPFLQPIVRTYDL